MKNKFEIYKNALIKKLNNTNDHELFEALSDSKKKFTTNNHKYQALLSLKRSYYHDLQFKISDEHTDDTIKLKCKFVLSSHSFSQFSYLALEALIRIYFLRSSEYNEKNLKQVYKSNLKELEEFDKIPEKKLNKLRSEYTHVKSSSLALFLIDPIRGFRQDRIKFNMKSKKDDDDNADKSGTSIAIPSVSLDDKDKSFSVYIIAVDSDYKSFNEFLDHIKYVGQTNNSDQRFSQHKKNLDLCTILRILDPTTKKDHNLYHRLCDLRNNSKKLIYTVIIKDLTKLQAQNYESMLISLLKPFLENKQNGIINFSLSLSKRFKYAISLLYSSFVNYSSCLPKYTFDCQLK